MNTYPFTIGDVVYLKHSRPANPMLVVDLIGASYVVCAFRFNDQVVEHILSCGSIVKPQSTDIRPV